jgi:hypothetical protein
MPHSTYNAWYYRGACVSSSGLSWIHNVGCRVPVVKAFFTLATDPVPYVIRGEMTSEAHPRLLYGRPLGLSKCSMQQRITLDNKTNECPQNWMHRVINQGLLMRLGGVNGRRTNGRTEALPVAGRPRDILRLPHLSLGEERGPFSAENGVLKAFSFSVLPPAADAVQKEALEKHHQTVSISKRKERLSYWEFICRQSFFMSSLQ